MVYIPTRVGIDFFPTQQHYPEYLLPVQQLQGTATTAVTSECSRSMQKRGSRVSGCFLWPVFAPDSGQSYAFGVGYLRRPYVNPTGESLL